MTFFVYKMAFFLYIKKSVSWQKINNPKKNLFKYKTCYRID